MKGRTWGKGLLGLAWLSGAASACVNGDTVDLASVPPFDPTLSYDSAMPTPGSLPPPVEAGAGTFDGGDAIDAEARGEVGDAAFDAGGPGYGKVRIYGLRADTELAAGVMVTAYFTRRPYSNCSTQPLDEVCRLELCGPAPEMPGLLSPGTVEVQGTTTCTLSAQSLSSYASCHAASLWSVGNLQQTLRVTATGDVFPKFDVMLAAPSRYALTQPPTPGVFGRGPISFRWSAEAVGEMEITLGQRPGCSEELLSRRVVCTVPASAGSFDLMQAHWKELLGVRCLSATALQRVARMDDVDGFRLEVSVELPYATAFDFVEPDRESCVGTHAACEVFSADEPTRCTGHGCSWKAGACAGKPHPCANVPLADCGNDAGTHPGCMLSGP